MRIINTLSIVCSEMLKFSRNDQNIKMFRVPPNTLPLVIYIGIFCSWVLLHYNISFKTIAGGFNGAFRWYGPFSEDREKLPKLSCGFNIFEIQGFITPPTKYILKWVNIVSPVSVAPEVDLLPLSPSCTASPWQAVYGK